MYAENYRDLKVYQTLKNLAFRIFELSKRFPPEEKYSLTSQMRRASRSAAAQIPEAWAKRRYKAHFISKLTDADGEQRETQHWIDTALDCGYINQSLRDELISGYEQSGRMIQGMIDKAESFCFREPQAEY